MEAAGASYATARLCEPTGGGREADDGCNPIVAAVTARGRLRSAVGHLGPGLSDVVILTSEGVPLKEIEERLQWPGRSAKVVLSLALDRLADHYGFL